MGQVIYTDTGMGNDRAILIIKRKDGVPVSQQELEEVREWLQLKNYRIDGIVYI